MTISCGCKYSRDSDHFVILILVQDNYRIIIFDGSALKDASSLKSHGKVCPMCRTRPTISVIFLDEILWTKIKLRIWTLNTTKPFFKKFEVGQCHRWTSLTFCFQVALFQLGVRTIILYTVKGYLLEISIIGHVRSFCVLATRLVIQMCEQETIIVTIIVALHLLDKIRTEVSCQFRA